MATGSGLGTGASIGLGVGAAAVVVAAVVYVTSPSTPPPVVPDEAAAPAVSASAPAPAEPVAPDPAKQPEPAAAPAAAPEPAPILPDFDVVRIEPDGSATVAGTAAPDARLSLRLDGAEVASAQADAEGKFAALFTLSPSAAPRLLSVVAVATDGSEVTGTETVAVAPIAEKVAPEVAAAPAAPAEAPVAEAPVAAEAPAAISLSPEGVKVVQPAAEVPAEVAANVGIDSIGYAPDGAVMLGGHGAAGELVRLYLDGAALAEAAVAADGNWSVTLADIQPGIYTLRADQVAADGKVTSRFETPFKRETREDLAAASAPAVAEPVAAAEPAPAPAPEPAAAPAPQPAEAAAVEPKADPAPEPVAEVAPVAAESSQPGVAPAPPAPVTVTVQPGFTLWGIAENNYGDGVLYVQVFDANKDKIKDPDLIYPGQVLLVPGSE